MFVKCKCSYHKQKYFFVFLDFFVFFELTNDNKRTSQLTLKNVIQFVFYFRPKTSLR